MKKVIAYDIVETGDVKECLAKGWQPLGSPVVKNGIFYQAVVLYDDTKAL